MTKGYMLERTSDKLLTVRMDSVAAGWEQWFLLTSDWHRDSSHFQADLFHQHLREAQKRQAGVFSFGDDHDLMQGRDDPRRSATELLAKYKTDDYLDAVVEDAIEELSPYAGIIEMMSDGNHGTSVRKKTGTNVTRRVAQALKAEYMGWAGYIRFMFSRGGNKGGRVTKRLWFEHGGGGGGKSSRGVQNISYRASYLPDADIVASGHVHWTWILPMRRYRSYESGKDGFDLQWHTSLPTYKSEFDPMGGYHMEKGREPRPIGGVWLRFFHDSKAHNEIGTELRLAVE